jgi:hypothetical protein
MLRREKRAQLTKNIIAESERVIEFGEHASYSLGSTAGCAFRDRFCRKPCEVVLDRGNLRIKIGDLPRRWEWQLIKPGCQPSAVHTYVKSAIHLMRLTSPAVQYQSGV